MKTLRRKTQRPRRRLVLEPLEVRRLLFADFEILNTFTDHTTNITYVEIAGTNGAGLSEAAARSAANSVGGKLTTIDSQAEQDFIASLPWNQFYLRIGESLSYSNWQPGEPNDPLETSVVLINSADVGHRWWDFPESPKYLTFSIGTIAEKPGPKAVDEAIVELTKDDEFITRGGLRGIYTDLATGAVVSRIDPAIDFPWGDYSSPDPSIGLDKFTATWTGFVMPEFSEEYIFTSVTDDGVKVSIDDQLLIDKWIDQATTPWQGSIVLEAGKLYPIKVEYYEANWGAYASLFWESPSITKQIIPSDRLFYTEAESLDDSASATNSRLPVPWHNYDLPEDVNSDWLVTPLDVLMIINQLNGNATVNGQLPATVTGPNAPTGHVDVNADGHISPIDPLQVINALNNSSNTGPQLVQPTFALHDVPDDRRPREGDWITVVVNNGINHSAVTIDVVYDGLIVYSHGFAETDDTGSATIRLQLPYKTLKSGHDEDGVELWIDHAGITHIEKLTLLRGLTIDVPKEIFEGKPFTIYVMHSAGETAVNSSIDYDAGEGWTFPFAETDGSGNATITYDMPRLIKNGADRDGAELRVKTKDVTWIIPITIVKGEVQDVPRGLVKTVLNQDGSPAPISDPSPRKAPLNPSQSPPSTPPSHTCTTPVLRERTSNTVDGIKPVSTFDAAYQFFVMNGDRLVAPFSQFDSLFNLQPEQFKGFKEKILSLKGMTHTQPFTSGKTENVGLGGDVFLTHSWAGQIDFQLTGTIATNSCGWSFSGIISLAPNEFDFGKKNPGLRTKLAEALTTAIRTTLEEANRVKYVAILAALNKFIPTVPPQIGVNFPVYFVGHRGVNVGGKW